MNMENKNYKWYMLSVAANREKQAIENLKRSIRDNNLQDYVVDYLIPTERKIISVKGKKVSRESLVFNGYAIVKMDINGEVLRTIRQTKYIQNVVSNNNKPSVVSDTEIARIMENMEVAHSAKGYIVGDSVKILEGAFNSFNGTVTAVNESKNEISVSIMILGRETNININIDNCEKITNN